MKKLLPILLVVALLLTGCGQVEVTEPNETTEAATNTEQKGLYDPDSVIEKKTKGAVLVYRLEKNDYFDISRMGIRLLLRAQDGTLTVLQGENCVPAASLSTGMSLQNTSPYFDAAVQGAAYYDPDTRQVVEVNPQLQEIGRFTMPEEMQGQPYISMAREEIYYCVPGEVRALDMQTGFSRLIRSHGYQEQYLSGIWFDGQVLLVCLLGEDGSQSLEYIASETGKTLHQSPESIYPFYTDHEAYVLHCMDGGVGQIVAGTRGGDCRTLDVQEKQFASALAMGGVIGYEAGDGLTLAFYELAGGKCTARVTLPGVSDPKAILTTDSAVWVLASEGEDQILCQWDPAESPNEDETVYTGTLFTAQNPDTEGLAACVSRAEQMSGQYGIKIHVWEDALANDDREVKLVPEHQVSVVNAMLDALEVALQQFPENFLRETVKAGWVHVNLVRSMDGTSTFSQYWQAGDCYITITNAGNVTEDFYRGVAYAIDSHVLGNSRKFDDWDDLNPRGFAYSYSYEPHPERDTYLDGEDRVFLTEKALAYPNDDRAEVFFYAMTPAGADWFQSDGLQAKLKVMCKAIREAYGLEKSADTYPWEQYLEDSLAYTR